MATGDQNDIAARLFAVLPQGWFASTLAGSPVLNAVIQGFAAALAWAYSLVTMALQSVLITTAGDIWLDLHAQDWFGFGLQRRLNESDTSFRARLLTGMFPPGATRAAISARLTTLTGTVPFIFEPTQPMDTGAYDNGVLAYSTAGGYGCLQIPFQAFVVATLPLGLGIPFVSGYSGQESAPQYAPGGYGAGAFEYVDLAQVSTGITDQDIYDTVSQTQPCGSIVWTAIKT